MGLPNAADRFENLEKAVTLPAPRAPAAGRRRSSRR
jgi:hypothetical protein